MIDDHKTRIFKYNILIISHHFVWTKPTYINGYTKLLSFANTVGMKYSDRSLSGKALGTLSWLATACFIQIIQNVRI